MVTGGRAGTLTNSPDMATCAALRASQGGAAPLSPNLRPSAFLAPRQPLDIEK